MKSILSVKNREKENYFLKWQNFFRHDIINTDQLLFNSLCERKTELFEWNIGIYFFF